MWSGCFHIHAQFVEHTYGILKQNIWNIKPSYNPTPLGLQQVRDIDTPKRKSGYLLPSQQFNLEDHATSDIHLLGLFLYGGLSLFRF
jgi:hypothetical protein